MQSRPCFTYATPQLHGKLAGIALRYCPGESPVCVMTLLRRFGSEWTAAAPMGFSTWDSKIAYVFDIHTSGSARLSGRLRVGSHDLGSSRQ